MIVPEKTYGAAIRAKETIILSSFLGFLIAGKCKYFHLNSNWHQQWEILEIFDFDRSEMHWWQWICALCIQVSLFWRGHLGILFVLYFYKFIKHEHEYIHVCKCSVNCCCSGKALLRDLLSVETIWVDNFKVGYHLTTSFQLCHVTQTQESANCTTI